MITKECITSIWRIYPDTVTRDQAEAHMVDFTGVCVMCYLTESKIFVKGMLADFTLSAKKEFIQACVEDGIEIIQMERATNRNLPFARRIDDHHEIRVADLMNHLNRAQSANRRKADHGT